MSIVKKIIGYGILIGTITLVGCINTENYQNKKFGAFNDETYVWENYQFTTNQVIEVK